MQTLTDMIVSHGLANRFLSVSQLKRLTGEGLQRRYGLVNRALKAGELIRLQRGVYVLVNRYRDAPCHPFAVAQALVPGSYVSFETALTFHGWIPEYTLTAASVVPGRKSRNYEHESMGRYTFHPLAVRDGFLLELVSRYQIDGQTMLVADPLRAVLDLVCLRKVSWQGIAWLIEGLRIDSDALSAVSADDFLVLKQAYRHKRVRGFLAALRRELFID